MLDIWEVTEPASVAEYQRQPGRRWPTSAPAAASPLVVGGSGLYVRAVLERFEFPGTDPELRAELEAELARLGPEKLHERLRRLDPAAAAAILPGNGRRIVRALEVIAADRRARSPPTCPTRTPVYPTVMLAVDRDDLDQRVAERVDRMWAQGWSPRWRRSPSGGCGRAAPPGRRWATSRCSPTSTATSRERGAGRDGPGHPPVRPPSAFLVPPRPRVVWLDGARPDLLTAALAAVRAAGG